VPREVLREAPQGPEVSGELQALEEQRQEEVWEQRQQVAEVRTEEPLPAVVQLELQERGGLSEQERPSWVHLFPCQRPSA
jgi:hypothetical protein